jgi:hypothetical protein
MEMIDNFNEKITIEIYIKEFINMTSANMDEKYKYICM